MSTLVATPANAPDVPCGQGQTHTSDDAPAPAGRQFLLVVLLPPGQPASAVEELPTRPGWRTIAMPSSGRHGADLKAAFREGLRAGAECLVISPHGAGAATVLPGLLQPIIAQRAEIVLPVSEAAVGREPLPVLPRWPATNLFSFVQPFVHRGPFAISRRALEVIPYEANSDDDIFALQLLGQARYFALEVAPAALPDDACCALRDPAARTYPSLTAQLLCGLEFLLHRWGLIDSPRLQEPQPAALGRCMITRDGT